MKSFKSLAVIGLVVSSVSAFGSGVTIPNTFTNATPAIASQVNGNFAAVKTAVDDNDARLDALEPSITPVVVNCTGSPGALQAALSSVKTGKLYINFSGTCSPVTITRSDVEIIGASRATAIIAGATGATTASVSIKNANNVTLKSLTIKRSDDQFVIAQAWRSNVTLDDVLVDHTTGGAKPEEGLRLVQSTVSIAGSDMEQVGAYVGTSAVFENNNAVNNTVGSDALDLSENSTILVLGNNNTFTSSGNVLGVYGSSTFSVDENSTGVSLMGNIDVEASFASFSVTTGIDGNIVIQDAGVVKFDYPDSPPSVNNAVTSNITIYSNGILKMDYVDLTGSIFANSGAQLYVRNSSISNGIELDRAGFSGQYTTISGGGILGTSTSFRLSEVGSNISGVFALNSGLNPDAWLGNGATHVGVTFNNCANGNMAFDGYVYGVCGNDDADGFVNYLDLCPAVAGPNNGCP